MKKYLLSLSLIVFVATACTPQQRLNRLQRQHPALFESDTISTTDVQVIERWDTVRLSGIVFDSTFLLNQADRTQRDTLRMVKDGITTTIYIQQRDTLTEYEVVTQIDSFQTVVIVRDTITTTNSVVTRYEMEQPLRVVRFLIIALVVMAGLYLHAAIRRKASPKNQR